MFSTGQLLGFALASLVLIVVPGPGVLFIVGRALAHGRRTAVATALRARRRQLRGGGVRGRGAGHGAGAVGQAFIIVKIAGALYLIWLGVHAIRQRKTLAEAMEVAAPRRGRVAGRAGRGVGGSHQPQGVHPVRRDPAAVREPDGRARTRADAGAGPGLGGHRGDLGLLWGFAASAVRAWFAQSPRRVEMVGGVGGLAMIGVGVTVALTGRHS